MIKKYHYFFAFPCMLLIICFAIRNTIYANRCIELTTDGASQLLAKEIGRNTQALEDALLEIEKNQEGSETQLEKISSTIDAINQEIVDQIISQSGIIKSFNFMDVDETEDFAPLEELNALYEQLAGISNALFEAMTKTTLEELENTLAQLQIEITLLEAQIEALRIQIETIILTNEVFITAAIQEIALQQLRQNAVPGLDFEAIFDGVAGFQRALDELQQILDFFCVDLCNRKKQFFKKLYVKPKIHKRVQYINLPGIYKIKKNVQDGIIIDSDNVIIDLNGHEVYSDSHTPLIIANNHKNIIIKNGRIRGGKNNIGKHAGILINKGAQYILVEHVDISFCNKAIQCKGQEHAIIKHCKIQYCTFHSNNQNTDLVNTIKTFFTACTYQ